MVPVILCLQTAVFLVPLTNFYLVVLCHAIQVSKLVLSVVGSGQPVFQVALSILQSLNLLLLHPQQLVQSHILLGHHH